MNKLPKEVFISEMKKIIEKNDAKRPYDINIIDELHANENAHTRLLMKLLQFSRNREYFILNKFLELLNENENLKTDLKIKKINNPGFQYQWCQIDGLIYSHEENNKIAIIIENKINWAEDQKEQIKRYVESVNKIANIPNDKIYVIYLTDDGTKKVSSESLTTEAKAFLGITENSTGRYIELNYKDNLLPLFKDILTYLEFSKEVFLKSTLIQYIDYLEGRFGLREREKEFYSSIMSELLELFDIDLINVTLKQRAQIYYELINYIKDDLNLNPVESHLYSTFLEKLKDKIYPKNEQPGTVKNNFYHYFVRHPENMYLLKFKEPFINFQNKNRMNIIQLKDPEIEIEFPNDNLNKETITIRTKKAINYWQRQNIFYTKEIPYVEIYKMTPVEFFDFIYELIDS
ncbi:MAG: PD-(D/E)XK nuclease family protein [Treponema sp.]|nr:PD-(D/E)XK nuclease family protein [Treponema sp.]